MAKDSRKLSVAEEKAAIEERIAELTAELAEQKERLVKISKKRDKNVKGIDSEGREIMKTKRSKFKCATSGKHTCDECGKAIERGDIIRFVDVKYADGTKERYSFCCGAHRNHYCDGHGIPQ